VPSRSQSARRVDSSCAFQVVQRKTRSPGRAHSAHSAPILSIRLVSAGRPRALNPENFKRTVSRPQRFPQRAALREPFVQPLWRWSLYRSESIRYSM
jgi:hypothetical protein